MSIGVGEVLTVIQLVYDLCQKCKNAQPEIVAAAKDMKQMKAELESIRDKANDEKFFIRHNGQAMLAMITDTFDDLIDDLQSMERLVHKYKKCPPGSIQWFIFINFQIQDVQTLQQRFSKYRSIYSTAFSHAAAVADAQNAAKLGEVASFAAKNKDLKAELVAVKKQQQIVAKAQKQNDEKVNQILKLLEKIALAATSSDISASTNFGNGKLVDGAKWENELVESGLRREEAKKIMGSLMLDSKRGVPPITITDSESGKSKGNGLNNPPRGIQRNKSHEALGKLDGLKAPEKRRGRSASPPGKANAGVLPGLAPAGSKWKPPSPSPLPLTTPKTVTPNKSAKIRNKYTWILCVDSTNGFHSILAQTYLELIRSWTANTSSKTPPTWLFSHVDSAGLNISTPLTSSTCKPPIPPHGTAGEPASDSAITALTSDPSYFRTIDWPAEKSTIMTRMKKHTSRGLRERDFQVNDYILCFNRAVFDGLSAIKSTLKHLETQQHAQLVGSSRQSAIKSEIFYLEGSEWFLPDKHTHAQEIDEVVKNIKDRVKRFLEREMGWVRPTDRGIDKGPYRTLQLVLPRLYRGKLVQGGKWTGSELQKDFEAKTGCMLQFTWDGVTGSQLVSLTGPKERLKEAEAWVKALGSTS